MVIEKKFENAPCDLCKSSEYTFVFSGPDRLTNLGGQFHVVKCEECGLLRQNPRLGWESLSQYYQEDYISYSLGSEKENYITKSIKRYGVWKKVRLIKKYKKYGKLLDIGCGSGQFLEEAKRTTDWSLSAIEPNQNAAQYVVDKLSIKVQVSRFEDIRNYPQRFDIVTMWDVFEHFYYPVESVKKINDLLNPGGILVFSIPNLAGWDVKMFKENWIGYDLPRHLYFFDKKNIQRILQESGFQILETRIVSGSFNSIKNDIMFSLNAKSNSFYKFSLHLYNNLISRVFLFLPLFIIDKLKINPVITYVVKKK